MLTESELDELREVRHEMRLKGCWGACYEVSVFIERRFSWRRVDGVFQLLDGKPVFKHSWNVGPDGTILDGTADQFGFGHDIAISAPQTEFAKHYRLKFTRALNPETTLWLKGKAYAGIPDEGFWQQRHEARQLGPGWWLEDNKAYLQWMTAGAEKYWLFRAKLQEYRELGYAVA